jgi:hypothetical protein
MITIIINIFCKSSLSSGGISMRYQQHHPALTAKPSGHATNPDRRIFKATDCDSSSRQSQERRPSAGRTNERLEALEKRLKDNRSQGSAEETQEYLNEYLNLGLELASQAEHKNLPALKESWLRRMHGQLRSVAFCDQCSKPCRQQCLQCLYQTFFALKHHYESVPDGELHLKRLNSDMSTMTRYLM